MERNPVGWFEIYVADMKRATAFYEKLLDISLTPMPLPDDSWGDLEMVMFPGGPERGGAAGCLAKMSPRKPSLDGTIVYFSSANCQTQIDRVETLGGKVFRPKTAIGNYGFIALLGDSEGNVIGIHSME